MKNRIEQIKEAIKAEQQKKFIIFTTDKEAQEKGTILTDDQVKQQEREGTFIIDFHRDERPAVLLNAEDFKVGYFYEWRD